MGDTIWSPTYTDKGDPEDPDDDQKVQTHGGVIPDNVTFDEDGNLILIVNGDWYQGDKQGHLGYGDKSLVSGGQRTGAVITSTRTYGPGSFEVVLKLPAFNGICSSIWLFNNFKNPLGGDNWNYEIDIEIHGSTTRNANNMLTAMCTSWITEKKSTSNSKNVGYNLADGQFHTYRIDWHTGADPYVEYYIDGVLVCTQRQSVCGTIPTNEMYFNIGCWFPNGWCGEPDFETDYMVVKSFSYTPFTNETADKENTAAKQAGRWKAGIEVPAANLIANGYFQYGIDANDAWSVVEGGTATVSDGTLTLNGTLVQNVYMDCLGISYNLLVSGSGNATVRVTYLSIFDGSTLGSVTGGLNELITLETPSNCTQLKIEIISDGEVTLNSVVLDYAA